MIWEIGLGLNLILEKEGADSCRIRVAIDEGVLLSGTTATSAAEFIIGNSFDLSSLLLTRSLKAI